MGRFDVAEEDLPQTLGFVTNDVIGQREIDFTLAETEVRFDYYATSIAADLGAIVEVTKVTVRPRSDTHRVEERHIDLFVSSFNAEGVWQQVTDYTFAKETDGSITFTLPFPVDARYVKVHAHWNELDEANNAVDRSTFINDKDAILSVSYFAKNRDESYTYDAKGNRLTERVTTEFTTEKDSSYSYYATSDRLKSDGIYGYRYDENGNLVEKGTVWTDSGDDITVDSTQGEYWRYEYDLLNRMIRAYERDEDSGAVELRVSYTYDFRGYRVLTQSVEHEDTRYTFDLSGMVLEESISGETINYIYAYARHLAKVEDYGTAEEETFFYLLDQVGTTVGITDESGALVWSADASPFGTEVGKTGPAEASLKYTGKDVDPDTGLYYFNARWYDATIGRFTTEDPIRDGWNWFEYARANPLRFVDPTGLLSDSALDRAFEDFKEDDQGYDDFEDYLLHVEGYDSSTGEEHISAERAAEIQTERNIEQLNRELDRLRGLVEAQYGEGVLESLAELDPEAALLLIETVLWEERQRNKSLRERFVDALLGRDIRPGLVMGTAPVGDTRLLTVLGAAAGLFSSGLYSHLTDSDVQTTLINMLVGTTSGALAGLSTGAGRPALTGFLIGSAADIVIQNASDAPIDPVRVIVAGLLTSGVSAGVSAIGQSIASTLVSTYGVSAANAADFAAIYSLLLTIGGGAVSSGSTELLFDF